MTRTLEPIQFGKHTLHYEEPGIGVVTYHGPVSVEEMRILSDVPDNPAHNGKFQLTICNMKEFGGMSSAARKIGSARARPSAIYYTAYVDADFTTRVIISMWIRATTFLQGPKNAAGFFDNHEDAKTWLLEMRQKHLAQDR